MPVYDYGEYEGRLFLVMKLMTGGSLETLVRRGPVPLAQVVALIAQVAQGLDFAHGRGHVHRDIKPGNVLLDERGNAVLADFGVVKAMESSTISQSLSGGILGTPSYVAPEVWNGKESVAGTDIYALACVAYELLTGARLFHAETPFAIMELHAAPPQYPEEWPAGVPAGMESVLDRALAQRPGDRYASAGAFAAALRAQAEDPLAKRYEAMERAVAAGRWDEAVALGEELAAADAGYREVRTLMARATDDKAAGEREAWQKQAEEAAAAGEWATAMMAGRRWQDLAPDDEAAAALMARVERMRGEAESLGAKDREEKERQARADLAERQRREARDQEIRDQAERGRRAEEKRQQEQVVVSQRRPSGVKAGGEMVRLGSSGGWRDLSGVDCPGHWRVSRRMV